MNKAAWSYHGAGLVEVLLTGGLPPGIHLPCAAHDAYRALYLRVMRQNDRCGACPANLSQLGY